VTGQRRYRARMNAGKVSGKKISMKAKPTPAISTPSRRGSAYSNKKTAKNTINAASSAQAKSTLRSLGQRFPVPPRAEYFPALRPHGPPRRSPHLLHFDFHGRPGFCFGGRSKYASTAPRSCLVGLAGTRAPVPRSSARDYVRGAELQRDRSDRGRSYCSSCSPWWAQVLYPRKGALDQGCVADISAPDPRCTMLL
jgi:hypothetical protein